MKFFRLNALVKFTKQRVSGWRCVASIHPSAISLFLQTNTNK